MKHLQIIALSIIVCMLTTEALARGLKINIQRKKNVQVEAEELPEEQKIEYFDNNRDVLPANEKDVRHTILESFTLHDEKNLAFSMAAEMYVLFEFMEEMRKIGQQKVDLMEEVLRRYADNGKDDYGTAKRHIKDLQKENKTMEKNINLSKKALQAMLHKFYADERVGEFYVGPDFREIMRSQLRTFLDLTKNQTKGNKKLKELHQDIKKSLAKGVHDMYLAALLTQSLEFAQKIPTRQFKPILSDKITRSSKQSLHKIKWNVDKFGVYHIL